MRDLIAWKFLFENLRRLRDQTMLKFLARFMQN